MPVQPLGKIDHIVSLGKIEDREKSYSVRSKKKAERFAKAAKESDKVAEKDKTKYGGEPIPWVQNMN